MTKLYSVQYQSSPSDPAYWHTVNAESEEVACDFVAELYSDVFGNKATIFKCVETEPAYLMPYGTVRPTLHAPDGATGAAQKCTTETLCPVHNVWHAKPPRR